MSITSITEYKRRHSVAPMCNLHDPSIPDEDKVQTFCHCWDHLESDDRTPSTGMPRD